MRVLAVIAVLLLMASPLRAAAWPAAFERYEEIAIQHPGRNPALRQVWQYAKETERMEELRARWEERVPGPEGVSYQLLLAALAELEGEGNMALDRYRRAAEAFPGSALVWELRGRCEAARKLPGALISLEKAAELEFASERVGTAVEGLIEEHLATGHLPEARAVLDRAVKAVRVPDVWKRLVRKRAEVARDQGRIVELIEGIEAAPAPDRGGGSELAEAYQVLGDYEQARAEMARARAARPADAVLGEQAAALYRAASLPSELARLRREEVQVAPSPEAWRAWFAVLVENGSAEEARAVLAGRGAALLPAPLEWRDLLTKFVELDLAKPLADLLAKEPAPGGWEGTLLRAELLIAEENWTAEETLWSLLGSAYDARPLSAETLASAGTPTSYQALGAIPGVRLMDRRYRLGALLTNGAQVFSPETKVADYRTFRVETLQDARDLALLYLAALAAETKHAPQFLARLETVTATWSRSERVLAWAVVENPPALLREIVAAAADPREGSLERFCQSLMPELLRLPLAPEWKIRVAELAARFPPPPERPGRAFGRGRIDEGLRAANTAFLQGGIDEAARLLTEARRMQPSAQPEDFTTCGMTMATSLRPFQGDPSKLAAGAMVAVRSTWVPTGNSRMVRQEDGNKALWPTQRPGRSYSTYQSTSGSAIEVERLPEAMRSRVVYPPVTLFTWEQSGVLWMVFSEVRAPAIWPVFKKRLDDETAKAPPEQALQARAAGAYFAWWNGESDDAIRRMRELVAESSDAGVRVGLAAMLRHQGPPGAAEQILGEMPLPYAAYERIVGCWRLRLAGERRDAAAATALARALAAGPGGARQWRELLPALETGGCTEAVALVRQRLIAESTGAEETIEVVAALRDLVAAGAQKEALDLARKVLAPSPFPRRTSSGRTAARRAALDVLGQLGQREAYLALFPKALATSPGALAAQVRLAEAASGKEAVEAWRDILAARPDDRQAAREMFNAADSDSAGKREALEKLLMLEPDALLDRQRDLLFYSYERAGELPRLAEAMARAPFRAAGPRRPRFDVETWRNLAQRFVGARLPESALLVLRKTDSLYAPVPASVQRLLVEQLAALNRRAEAGQALLDYFAPPGAEGPELFSLRATQAASREQAAVEVALLNQARELDMLPELRQRLETGTGRSLDAASILLHLRIMAHEPEALPQVEKWAADLSSETKQAPWTVPLLTELAAWPEGREAGRKLLAASESMSAPESSAMSASRMELARLAVQLGDVERALRLAKPALTTAMQRSRTGESRQAMRDVVEIALTTRDPELLEKCRAFFVQALRERTEANGYYETDAALRFAEGLLAAGQEEEARPVIKSLRAYAQKLVDRGLALRLRMLDLELELQRGEWGQATTVVWLDPDRTTADRATLVWDVGLLGGGDEDAAGQPILRKKTDASPGGKVTVELFFGEDEICMQSLARLDHVEESGTWQGKLPASAGYVRAVISRGEKTLMGKPFAIWNFPNLLQDQNTQGSETNVPAGGERKAQGGPTGEGEYVSFRPYDYQARGSNVLTVDRRVPVRAGRDYFLSGWLRSAGARSVKLGWRFLDRQGKPVGDGEMRDFAAGGPYWSHGAQRLNWPADDNTGGPQLPVEAAFIEPVVRDGGGGFDLAGLSLLEIPPVPQERP